MADPRQPPIAPVEHFNEKEHRRLLANRANAALTPVLTSLLAGHKLIWDGEAWVNQADPEVITNASGTALRWDSGIQVVYRRSDLNHSDVTVSAASILLTASHAANFNASPVGLPFVGIRVQAGSMTPFRGLTNTHFVTMSATNVSLSFRKANSVTEGFDDTGIDTNDNPASNFMGYVAIGTWK